jgi:hypothetical protein
MSEAENRLLRWGPSRPARLGGLLVGASLVGAGLAWLAFREPAKRAPGAWPNGGRRLAKPRRGLFGRLFAKRAERSLEDLARRIY